VGKLEKGSLHAADFRSNFCRYALLLAMQRIEGAPILCNTSFNQKGNPILNRVSPQTNAPSV
jgi:predicted NodU family carbamoyl transferase